jgi:TorA maturation chaperone TorD
MSAFPSELTSLAVTAGVFRVAATLYLQEPSIELARILNEYLPQQTGIPSDLIPGDSLETLRQEYFDLFCVPVSGRYLPPFESVQREKRLWGPLTQKVAELYRACNFALLNMQTSPLWQAQFMPDHIGYELAFVEAMLKSRQADPSPALRQELDNTLRHFWRRHPSCWVAAYGHKLADNAQTGIYRFLGLLTEAIGQEAGMYL